ncbi:unnamed protein product [Rotaria sp. Silwood1]|nr:unnamed protein product [Rotaria sp. Silwood1]CAF3452117.1 unnamed protein product [Rotaria sp. Silwood1]CAF4975164.1 unnamed protein product [Rotaria sp. Silwood1]
MYVFRLILYLLRSITNTMSNRQITLESNDKQKFEVNIDILEQSKTIKDVMENCGAEEGTTIPLPNVDSTNLKKIIEWMTHHKDDIPSFDDDEDYGERKKIEISKWDQDFLKIDQSSLIKLLLAANYLDISKLIDIICKTIADMMNGKTTEQIRETFNIQNDFTPEEVSLL